MSAYLGGGGRAERRWSQLRSVHEQFLFFINIMQTTIYKPEDEQELMAVLWSPALKDNPLAFVKYLFP